MTAPKTNDGHDYKWWVPITFTKPGEAFDNTYSKTWLEPTRPSKTVQGLPDSSTPAIFNVQQTGYYRVNYDRKNWEMIIDQLNRDHTKIHVVNRAQIIDDALNLARAGLLDYELALRVTGYLNKETKYIAWMSALSGFGYIDLMLERSAAYGEFHNYMRRLIRPIFARVGYEKKEGDAQLDIFLRSKVVGWACKLDMPECTEKVTDNFEQWMSESDPDAEEANP